MRWFLGLLAAAVALYFLLRARNQAAKRFREMLEARDAQHKERTDHKV